MSVSPMMQQFQDAKAAHPDAILLFRMGDFYELFHDDARTAARVLGLALTSREKGENAIPMAGFPHHQLEGYLCKLIAGGYRAAICEQVEDPRHAKGLVRREVVRVVSPGTLTDDALLDPRSNNFLAAVLPGATTGLAWVDLSTGRFQAECCAAARLADELARIQPSEILIPEDHTFDLPAFASIMISRRSSFAFAATQAHTTLNQHFGTQCLDGFGWGEADTPAICAAGAILDYLRETQKASLTHVCRLQPYQAGQVLEMDEATRRSLEIVRTARDARREGSLLAALDRTVTAMGSRLLADWLSHALTDVTAIDARLAAVEELMQSPSRLTSVREQLRKVYDLERLLARVITQRASPRDLSFVGQTLAALPSLVQQLSEQNSELLQTLVGELDLCPELQDLLSRSLVDDCPLAVREGGIIRLGYSAELDALRELAAGGKQWIARYQADEQARSGIPSLKVGFNKVFGYYLEVTHTNSQKIPDNYIRKQTIKNAERYITPELKEYEEKVLTADERSKELEYALFLELRQQVAAAAERLQQTAARLAQLDVLGSLAELARARNYCRPRVVSEPVLEIVEGRHPVLDLLTSDGSFVPNDTQLGAAHGTIMLITGPNMAGKSTYIRQVALLTLMAQIGSFLPARQATIGVADRIFARVGASDELARGQSTFMVEMTETARILNTATHRSLVILDEIGRGTSTYDGLSLAWSVVEHLHQSIHARTLFATHYHELTALAKDLTDLRNFNVAVREWQEQVIFLHKILPGAADRSYGIHVARLAGVPREVIERAKQILAELEDQGLDASGHARITQQLPAKPRRERQLPLFAAPEEPLLDELRQIRLEETTPLAALQLLQEWQQRLKS